MLAGGDEDLRAADPVAAVGLLDGLGPDQPEIGAALRLGQVHRAGPLAGDHLGQVARLQLRRAMDDERRDRALGQSRIHGEGHVGGAEEFVDDLGQHARQALAAEFGRHRDADPAARDDLLEGVLEAVRRGDAAVGMARAALLVADPVERRERVLAELGRFAQNGLDQVGRGVGEAGQIGMTLDMEDVAQQEHDVVDRGLVDRHGLLPRGSEWMERLGHQGGGNAGYPRCSPPANRISMAHPA